jgi:hypothetical protein
MSENKHKNYEILNLIGYGLAKFSMDFVKQFGFTTKTNFYKYLIDLGVGEKESTFKMRQDLLDPFFDNDRVGFASRGDTYKHRKIFVDSLFGDYDVKDFADVVKLSLKSNFQVIEFKTAEVRPIVKSKFRQLAETGKEAEEYFKSNYQQIETFKDGIIEDARMWGDGYDFQIQIETKYFLADVKGIRSTYGAFRMTDKEYLRAQEYKNDYGLVVVSNLQDIPKMTTIFNPVAELILRKQEKPQVQTSYHSDSLKW